MIRGYINKGLSPIPLKQGTKEPRDSGWPNRDYTPDEIADTDNVGTRLGDVVDADLDTQEAVLLAHHFLPPTQAVFGRLSKPRSHYLYEQIAKDLMRRKMYSDVDGTLLFELRGEGHQTMIPPSIHPDGEQVRWAVFEEIMKITLADLLAAAGKLAAAVMLARHWAEWEHRHHMIALALSGWLLRAGWTPVEVKGFLKPICDLAGDTDWVDKEKAIDSTADKLEAGDEVVGFPRLVETIGEAVAKKLGGWLQVSDDPQRAFTDLGNAERFRDDHGHRIRYCADERCWYVYDGKRWVPDRTGEVYRLARKTVRGIPDEAKRYPSEKEDHAAMRKKIFAWSMQSENQKRLEAMVKLAQHDEAIAIRVEDFDRDPYLLNMPEGTYNLRIGWLQPHDPADLIRRSTAASYVPDATSGVLDTFLIAATEGWDVAHGQCVPSPEEAVRGEESRAFLQRLAGYSLIGETPEEVSPLLHGPEASGKSTVVAMILSAMGDYAKTTDFETFLKRKQPGGIRTDLVRIADARIVASIEVDDGKELAEGMFKRLTGGDEQQARGLYTSKITLRPTATFWLVVNHAPLVSASDGGMWRRILRFPFPHTVPREHREPAVKRTLTDPSIGGPAVLRWLIDGYRAWQNNGLMIPDFVFDATEEMRSDMDPVSDFLEDMCMVNPNDSTLTVKIATLWEAYRFWTRRNLPAGRELTRKAFGEALTRRGIVRDKGTGGVRIWRGVSLQDFVEDTAPQSTGARTIFGRPQQRTA